jgi:hypothetical protein
MGEETCEDRNNSLFPKAAINLKNYKAAIDSPIHMPPHPISKLKLPLTKLKGPGGACASEGKEESVITYIILVLESLL